MLCCAVYGMIWRAWRACEGRLRDMSLPAYPWKSRKITLSFSKLSVGSPPWTGAGLEAKMEANVLLGDCGILRYCNFYIFTAPSDTPLTKYFCRDKKTMMIGMMETKTAGKINSQGFPYCPESILA